MLARLLLLFTVVPLTEFFLLSLIHERIGLLGTVALVLATGALGATLAKWQGVATLMRIRQNLAAGEPPADALLDGALILLAGAVLITPGVLTDAVGFGLLAPPVRAALRSRLKRWFAKRVKAGVSSATFVWTSGKPGGANVVDAEVVEVRTDEASIAKEDKSP